MLATYGRLQGIVLAAVPYLAPYLAPCVPYRAVCAVPCRVCKSLMNPVQVVDTLIPRRLHHELTSNLQPANRQVCIAIFCLYGRIRSAT